MQHMNHFLPDLSRLALPTGTRPEGSKRPRTEEDGGDVPASSAYTDGMEAETVDTPSIRWFPVIGKKEVFKLLDMSKNNLQEFDANPLNHRIWTRGNTEDWSGMDFALNYKADPSKMLWTNAKLMYQQTLVGPKVGIMRFYTVDPSVHIMSGVFEGSHSTGMFDDYTLARDGFEAGETVEEVRDKLAKANPAYTSAEQQNTILQGRADAYTQGFISDPQDHAAVVGGGELEDPNKMRYNERSIALFWPIGARGGFNEQRRVATIQADRGLMQSWFQIRHTVMRLDAYLTRAIEIGDNRPNNGQVHTLGTSVQNNSQPFMLTSHMIPLERNRKEQMEKDIDAIGNNFYGPDGNSQSSMLLPRVDWTASPQLLVGVLSTQQSGSTCGMCKRAIGVMPVDRKKLAEPDGDTLRTSIEQLLQSCPWL